MPDFQTIQGSPSPDALARYVVGDCRPDEAEAVRAWLEHQPAAAAAFGDALARLDGGGRPLSRAEVFLSVEGLRRKIDEAEFGGVMVGETTMPGVGAGAAPRVRRGEGRPFGVRRAPWRRALAFGIPAALVAAAAVVIGVRREGAAPVTWGEAHAYATATGQRAVVRLPNGTRMMLAPGSRARVARSSEGGYGVALDGEASFDVATSARAPFVVRVGDVSARVLGTRFSVRNGAGITQIVVAEGKVAVTRPDAPTDARMPTTVVLGRGGVVRVTDSTMVSTTVRDPDELMRWTDGRLVFRDTPVPEMLAALGRWYGYNFKLTDPDLASRHVNAVFDGTPADEMLRALQTVLDAAVSVDAAARDGNGGPVVTIRRRGVVRGAMERRAVRDSLTSHGEVGR